MRASVERYRLSEIESTVCRRTAQERECSYAGCGFRIEDARGDRNPAERVAARKC